MVNTHAYLILSPRSVLCNDAEITVVPPNFPKDTSKLRIEKTAITRISSENFHYLSNLEFLWMSFNAISSLSVDSFRGLKSLDELRLDGNAIDYFPWKSLMYMPNLRLLDLHNNKMSSIPAEATMYIKNISYLDLSSNALTTVPGEILELWLSVKPAQETDASKRILGEDQSVAYSGRYLFLLSRLAWPEVAGYVTYYSFLSTVAFKGAFKEISCSNVSHY